MDRKAAGASRVLGDVVHELRGSAADGKARGVDVILELGPQPPRWRQRRIWLCQIPQAEASDEPGWV
jgi:hypothetical protein